MKVEIQEVESVLLEKKIEPKKVSEIIRALEEIVEEVSTEDSADVENENVSDDNDDDSDLPKVKWEHLIVLNDPDNVLKGNELMGWVIQQKEGDDAGKILSKIVDSAKEQNEGAKRKKTTLTTMVQVFEGLKSKFVKSKNIRIKTKEAVRVLVTDGKIV